MMDDVLGLVGSGRYTSVTTGRATQLGYGLVLCACAVLAVLYGLGGGVRLGVHFAIAQVCHGVSAGKIGFVLGYVALVMLRLLLARRVAARSDGGSRAWNVMVWASAVGLTGAMLSHVTYTFALGLPTSAPTLHWLGGLNSINSVAHTHTSKAIIALVLEWSGQGHLTTRFDTGAPYARVVPVWVSVMIGLSFLTALACSVWASAGVVARYPSPQRVGVGLVFALAGSALVKCIVDGGPAAYDCVCAVITLALLRRGFSCEDVARLAWRHALKIITLLGLWLCGIGLVAFSVLAHQAEHALYRLTLHALVLVLTVWSTQPAGVLGRRARLAGCGLASIAGALCYGEARSWLVPMFGPAQARAVVHGSDGRAQVVGVNAASVHAAYRALGDSPTRVRRVSFPGGQGATGFFGQLLPLRHGKPTGALSTFGDGRVALVRVEPASESEGLFNVEVRFAGPDAPALCPLESRPMTALDENERFVAYHLLDSALRRAGLEEYVLVPYVLYADRPTGQRVDASADVE